MLHSPSTAQDLGAVPSLDVPLIYLCCSASHSQGFHAISSGWVGRTLVAEQV